MKPIAYYKERKYIEYFLSLLFFIVTNNSPLML